MKALTKKCWKTVVLIGVPLGLFAWINHLHTSTPQYRYRQIVAAIRDHNEPQLSYLTTAKGSKELHACIADSFYSSPADFSYVRKSQLYAQWLSSLKASWDCDQVAANRVVVTLDGNPKAQFTCTYSDQIFTFIYTDHHWMLDDIGW